MSFIKKYWKAFLFVTVELILLFVTGIGAFIFEDDDRFSVGMQNAWPFIGIVSLALFIAGIYWFANSKKKW